jgi:hypothetical protein
VIATEKTKKPISNSCPAKTVLVFRMLSEKNRNASKIKKIRIRRISSRSNFHEEYCI